MTLEKLRELLAELDASLYPTIGRQMLAAYNRTAEVKFTSVQAALAG